MENIVTRFAPSPSGYLHIGGARTALFNWLYARKHNGRFILRIEDSDAQRSTKESVDTILDSLKWLGMDWDLGPYYQTERGDIYREYIDKLVADGHAYYCDCSPEEVEAMREKAKAEGRKPMYNGRCRERNLSAGHRTVVRLKTPDTGTTVVEDGVKGNTAFQNDEIDDFIIQRSNGAPMYNFAVVVDDITMGVNTVIRGDDHLINTPKQILLYEALNADIPLFAHVPMVLGPDRKRLSKRHGAMSVGEYRTMGYLPDAVLNYLARLGWSFGDQEFFTKEELVAKFSLENLGTSAGMFDPDRLLNLNAKHIQAKAPYELAEHLLPLLHERGVDAWNDPFTQQVVATLQPRSKTLVEMADSALFYYKEDIEIEEKAKNKFLKTAAAEPLKKSADYIEQLDSFTEKDLEDVFKKVMDETGLKFGKIAQPVRVALTGTTVSPGIFEMILALGQEKTVARIRSAVALIEASETDGR